MISTILVSEAMRKDALFSSKYMEWETPIEFFKKLNEEFHFTLDPCCTVATAKCDKFYTTKENGLLQDWKGETAFVNPPYGRQLFLWVQKCFMEGQKPGTTIVMLIPARTDTRYFHDYIYRKAKEIRFLKGRLRFSGAQAGAPFPSMVVVFQSVNAVG